MLSPASTKDHSRFSDEHSESVRTILLDDESHSIIIRPRDKARWPWIASTIVLAITTIVQLLRTLQRNDAACGANYAPTELGE